MQHTTQLGIFLLQHHVNIIKFRCGRFKLPSETGLSRCFRPPCALLISSRKVLIIITLHRIHAICAEIPAWSIRARRADIMRRCMKLSNFGSRERRDRVWRGVDVRRQAHSCSARAAQCPFPAPPSGAPNWRCRNLGGMAGRLDHRAGFVALGRAVGVGVGRVVTR